MDSFIFDLDMTLVDTSSLFALRAAERWDDVIGAIDSAVPLNTTGGHLAPHELPRVLKELGHKIGIVTTSRRKYAKLLATEYSNRSPAIAIEMNSDFDRMTQLLETTAGQTTQSEPPLSPDNRMGPGSTQPRLFG